MTTITSLGTGSGLDLEGMITKLMAVEQQPLVNLQQKEASYQAKISSLGTLSSSLSSLQTAAAALMPAVTQTAVNKFASYAANSSDTTIATASATTGATAGTYSLSNIVLAKAQQLQITNGSSGITIPAAAGTLSIQVGTGTAVNVSIPASASMSDISTAINSANAGVSASVVNDGTADHLILTSNSTGSANTISITGSGTGWTGGPFDYSSSSSTNKWTQTTAAANATLSVNGISVSSASNTLTSAISGVTLNLVAAGSTTVTVSKDTTTSLTSALNAFVSAYNSANTSMSSLGSYNATTQVAGALQGDSTLRSAQNQLSELLFSTVAGGTSSYQRLSDIGISVAKDGSLSLDTTKLNSAISADYSDVANLVATAGTAFNSALDGIVGTSGTIATATQSANSSIKDITAQEAEVSNRLSQIEANYRTQFTALDTLIASMSQTSSYLTQQLASIASITSSSK